MSIKTVQNPVDDSEVTLVEGIVAQVSFKDIPNGADKFGNTHRAGIRIDDDWVNNVNIKTKEGNEPQVRFNAGTTAAPDWQTLEVGDKVRMTVTPNEYNGKTYYNGGVSKIKLLKKGEGGGSAQAQQNGGAAPKQAYAKKDMSGVSTGHAINIAINILGSDAVDNPDAVIELAKQAHTLTQGLKAEYAAKNPSMSDYDLGAMVGQSLLSASNITDFESLEAVARDTLDVIVPAVSAFVKPVEAKAAAPKKAAAAPKKAVAKKAVAKKAAPPPEDVPDADDNDMGDGPNYADMDDDIPF